MPHLDELMKEFSEEENKNQTPPAEDTPPAVEDKPNPDTNPEDKPKTEDAPKPDDKPATEDKPKTDENKPDPKPDDEQKPGAGGKPDLSTISKEEKAEHAFKRQLGKQASKYEAIIADMSSKFDSKFEAMASELAEIKKQKAEEPLKTRKDFPMDKGGDDEYISYLSRRQVQAELDERDRKAAEDRAEQDRKDADARRAAEARDESTRMFAEHSHAAFDTPEKFDAFSRKVQLALENGLGELLDQTSTLRDFVFRNPEGPIVLDRMLSDPNDFKKVYTQTDPTMMIIAAHELAQRKPAEPAPAPAPEPPKVPHMGKPGARNVSSEVGSMFNSDKDLMAYVRGIGSRRR